MLAHDLLISRNLRSSSVERCGNILRTISSCVRTYIGTCSLHMSLLLSYTGALICSADCLNLKISFFAMWPKKYYPTHWKKETTLSSNRTMQFYASCVHGRPAYVEFFNIYNVRIRRMWFLQRRAFNRAFNIRFGIALQSNAFPITTSLPPSFPKP